jgi:nucleotide-binding universal stress UspA family protein
MAENAPNVPTADSSEYAIVVGFDDSDRAERTLDVALEVAARRSTARLRVVKVLNSATAERHRDREHSSATDVLKHHLERRIEERTRLGKGIPAGSRLDVDVQFGPPADRLLAVAEALRADLIVVGRTAHSDQGHEGEPSVSDTVLMDAKCPVLVVTGRHDGGASVLSSKRASAAIPERS